MHVIDPTDKTPRFVEPPHVEKLTDLRKRTLGVVTACAAQDPAMPTLPSVAEDLARTREAFERLHASELAEASKLEATIRAAEQRAADFELAVRAALAEGQALPSPSGSEALVATVIAEGRAVRVATFPLVEAAAAAFETAARHAAGSRSLLLRLRREPERIEAERVLEEIRLIDSRIAVARRSLDAPSVERAFRAEGLLGEGK